MPCSRRGCLHVKDRVPSDAKAPAGFTCRSWPSKVEGRSNFCTGKGTACEGGGAFVGRARRDGRAQSVIMIDFCFPSLLCAVTYPFKINGACSWTLLRPFALAWRAALQVRRAKASPHA